MSLTSKLESRAQMMLALARRFPLRGLVSNYDKKSDLVLWIPHRYPESWLSYLAGQDSVVRDVALIDGLVNAGVKFRIVTGKNIGSLSNSTIIFSIDHFNPIRVRDYSAALMATLRELEDQGNTLYPSADESEYWENKVFMHRRFEELGIRTPRTIVLDRESDIGTDLASAGMEFPVIVKEPHSNNSNGVFKADDLATIESFRRDFVNAGSNEFLVQSMLDMRRDLRVVLMGGEIVLQHWRINNSEEWLPTTTRLGSQVDFNSFPEQWADEMRKVAATLGARNIALDVCWDGDDLDTEPYILEVSPAYTPNPTPPPEYEDRPFADYKSEVKGQGSYRARFVDVIFDLHRQLLAVWGFPSQTKV